MTSSIADFWNWFSDHQHDVKAAYDRSDARWLHANLTNRVKQLEPRLNWEIGPYHHPDETLVISPGVRENIPLAGSIVDAAPTIPGWHFLPAKPPKELNTLTMMLPGDPSAEICGDAWRYRLTAYNQREFFDIEVVTDGELTVDDDRLELLTRRLIEALLGEVMYLQRIAAVSVYADHELEAEQGFTPLPLLRRHLDHLLATLPE